MKIVLGFGIAVLCASLSLGACSSEKNARPTPAEADLGAIGLSLQLGGGVTLDSATYKITGPGGFTRTGTIDLRTAATLSALIGGLPAGAGYTIEVSASGTGVTCGGSATFAVMPQNTTVVVVHLQCRLSNRTGSILVNGSLNVCPIVDAVSAAPAEAYVGSTISLEAAAHDLDGGPQAVSYQWTAGTGTFSAAGVANPTFTCTAPGPAVVTVTISDGDCGETTSLTLTCTPAPVLVVRATVETDPVPHAGDAADDPAVWVNPIDPALSTIIGTDKTDMGGLGVYDLAGHQIQFLTAGALNNVDLRAGFALGGATVALVTAGNRTNNSIAIFKIDPATRLLSDVAARTITTLTTYGSCMYHSAVTGKFYYFVDSKAGDIEQWELFDNGMGLVDATKIRNLRKLGSQPEACVADDELGVLYVGEEDVGIWKYGAEPGSAPDPVLVDSTGPGGHLVADVEGLAIARTGAGTGYLVAANQGDSTYALYTREGANTFLKLFRVGTGCADEVTGSDGIDVVTAALGPAFPSGVFVTQDDTNGPSGNQNFKLVPWQDILNGPGPGGSCQPDAGAQPDAAPGPDTAPPPPDTAPMTPDTAPMTPDTAPMMSDAGAPGFPPAFCATFCDKCAGCWNPTVDFSEGDCLYQSSKPNFSLDDCLAGCAVGATPGFPPANLPAGWETLACKAFDDSI